MTFLFKEDNSVSLLLFVGVFFFGGGGCYKDTVVKTVSQVLSNRESYGLVLEEHSQMTDEA